MAHGGDVSRNPIPGGRCLLGGRTPALLRRSDPLQRRTLPHLPGTAPQRRLWGGIPASLPVFWKNYPNISPNGGRSPVPLPDSPRRELSKFNVINNTTLITPKNLRFQSGRTSRLPHLLPPVPRPPQRNGASDQRPRQWLRPPCLQGCCRCW